MGVVLCLIMLILLFFYSKKFTWTTDCGSGSFYSLFIILGKAKVLRT
jgi:hypothetical protein